MYTSWAHIRELSRLLIPNSLKINSMQRPNIMVICIGLALLCSVFSCYKEPVDYSKDINDLKALVTELQQRSDSLATALGNTNTNLNNLSKSVDSIKLKLTGIQTQIDALTLSLTTANANIAAINAQLILLNQQYASLLAQLNAILAILNAAPPTLADGLVAYYPFSGNAGDSSGNGNHGTVNGATLTTDRFGNVNRAYNFDGTNSIVVNDNDILDLTNDFTISSWINSSSYPTNSFGGPINMIICKRPAVVSDITGTYSFGIWEFNGSHIISFQAPPNASPVTYPGSNGTIQLNQWYNFTATYYKTNKELKYYLNGTEVFKSNLDFQITNTPYNLTIGALTSANTYFWNGKLDEIRIYNRALAQSEITYLASH